MLAEAVRPIEVLLVEDDEGDVLMTREALDEGKVFNRLNVVGDGPRELLLEAAEACPAGAISVVDADTGEQIYP